MTNLELAKKIVELIGGKENVIKVANCMTRLRVNVKDENLINTNQLKSTEGVLGIVQNGDYLQIVLGPGKAKKVADICIEDLNLPKESLKAGEWKENKAAVKGSQKESKFKKVINVIANIFIPLIPAIIAAGIFNGLGSLISTLQGQGVLSSEGFWKVTQLMFSLIGGGFLGYFAIYTGIISAKQFGANEGLGGM
ncbi:MAG: PTS transporter subunit EIIB, partial [Clostridium celatum]|nr:PTS transporter subunit EIIB [Clostridium celatum]